MSPARHLACDAEGGPARPRQHPGRTRALTYQALKPKPKPERGCRPRGHRQFHDAEQSCTAADRPAKSQSCKTNTQSMERSQGPWPARAACRLQSAASQRPFSTPLSRSVRIRPSDKAKPISSPARLFSLVRARASPSRARANFADVFHHHPSALDAVVLLSFTASVSRRSRRSIRLLHPALSMRCACTQLAKHVQLREGPARCDRCGRCWTINS